MTTPRQARTLIARLLKTLELNVSSASRRLTGDATKTLTEVWLGSPEDAQRLAAAVRSLYRRSTVEVGRDERPRVLRRNHVAVTW